MRELRDRVAVVTGAASGIGRALATGLAQEGCRLAISDINTEGLEETRRLVAAAGASVDARRLDVTDRSAVYGYADEVAEHYGAVNLVINNAGVALIDTVSEITYDDFEWLMNINFWGVVYGTKAFLPYLKRADAGHVINISSILGSVGMPTQAAYSAAKFAVRGFTEALNQELLLEGALVRATSVHPGGIDTNIVVASRYGRGGNAVGTREQLTEAFQTMARTSPEKAAKIILRGLKRGKRRILVGGDAVFIDWVQRTMPSLYQRFFVAATRRQRRLNRRRADRA